MTKLSAYDNMIRNTTYSSFKNGFDASNESICYIKEVSVNDDMDIVVTFSEDTTEYTVAELSDTITPETKEYLKEVIRFSNKQVVYTGETLDFDEDKYRGLQNVR